MLYSKSPIGLVEVPIWLEKELLYLPDTALIERAVLESNQFCISPSVYAMVVKRNLETTLQQALNHNISVSSKV